jgi:hypothetical protein
MDTVIAFLVGAVLGFLVHAGWLRATFKSRVVARKSSNFEALVDQWVAARNFIAHGREGAASSAEGVSVTQGDRAELDRMYGNSQTLLGRALLACEDDDLVGDVNAFNEDLFRTEWSELGRSEADRRLEDLKLRAFGPGGLVPRMREDIKRSTRLEKTDLSFILLGLRGDRD